MEPSWYVRRGCQTKGPFPESMIRELARRRRLRDADELSQDMLGWQRFGAMRESLRWTASGRGGAPPRPASPSASPGRRVFLRQISVFRRAERLGALALLAVGVGLAGVAAAGIALTPTPQAASSCESAPRPGVDWSNCKMEARVFGNVDLAGASLHSARLREADLMGARLLGANLAYAELSRARLAYAELARANLIGADLRGADLSYAGLDGANLSYADLSGANLGGASLDGTRLDHAIWVDASICQAGSIGRCLR